MILYYCFKMFLNKQCYIAKLFLKINLNLPWCVPFLHFQPDFFDFVTESFNIIQNDFKIITFETK